MTHRGSVALFTAIVASVACGKTGSPLPPLPRGPLPPADVVVRQVGNVVQVRYTVPQRRGERTKQAIAGAELWRVGWAEGVEPASDPGLFGRRGDLVAVEAAGEWTVGVRRLIVDPDAVDPTRSTTLRYAVRLRDRSGRSSQLVAAADLRPLPPSPAPAAPQAVPIPGGVRVSWQAPRGETGLRFNVYRSREDNAAAELPLNGEPIDGTSFEDDSVETDVRYRYVVRALLANGEPRREGRSSDVATVVAIDLFPPSAPTGLVAVQEGAAVKLFWDPNVERDLEGYRIYRRLSGEAWSRLEGGSVTQPNWLDTGVSLGDSSVYRVTAIDRANPPNESEPSSAVEIDLLIEPSPPGGGVAP